MTRATAARDPHDVFHITMQAYAIGKDSPDPDLFVPVKISDGWTFEVAHWLWVPTLDAWDLDIVRMVLFELSAHVPPSCDAIAGVSVLTKEGTGRAPWRGSRPPKNVEFWIRSRGCRVSISTRRNYKLKQNSARRWVKANYPTGQWSEAMRRALPSLAIGPPFALRDVKEALASESVAGRYPSRYRLQISEEEGAPMVKTRRHHQSFLSLIRARHEQMKAARPDILDVMTSAFLRRSSDEERPTHAPDTRRPDGSIPPWSGSVLRTGAKRPHATPLVGYAG